MKKTIIIAVTHEWNEYLKEFNNIEYYYGGQAPLTLEWNKYLK